MLKEFKKYKTKENYIVLSILIIFTLIWLFLFLNFSTLWAQDSFWYARLGENLATGNGFTLDGVNPHAQYPLGLPLLVIPLFFILGDIFSAGVITMFLLSLGSVILAYNLGKEISPFVGLTSAILLASHNLFIFNSMSVMTETPFMFFSILGLYLFMKSYKKRILIIPSIICITFSILIRYDGFFLIFPIALYMIYRRKDFEEFFFSKKTFTAIGIGILVLGSWFLRNMIAFGTPLFNAHSSGDGSTGLSPNTIWEFSKQIIYTGYLFPILALLGIMVALLFYKKNIEIRVYLLWVLTYVLFHSWWWARGPRFYGEILILLCFFIAIEFDYLIKIYKKKRGLLKKITYLLILLLVFEQLFIFYSGSINHESTIYTLNRYDPIREASEYANKNLPEDAVYIFPEYVVYTNFLNKKEITTYQSGLNHLLSTKGTIYFFTDNLHPWITGPFIPKGGEILLSVPLQQGTSVKVALYPQEIKTFEKDSGEKVINATIWKIEGFEIVG